MPPVFFSLFQISFFFYLKKELFKLLIYSVMFQVYSKVIQLYIYIFILFFRLFSIIGYYKILSIVPCAIQKVLVVYLFYI